MTQENKDIGKKIEKKHPGCINETEGYEKMLHHEAYLKHLNEGDMI